MEGWLSVPPSERNLIGRSSWKVRYVRFADSPPAPPTAPVPNLHRASIATSSVSRPVTASSCSGDNVVARRPPLEKGHASHQSIATTTSSVSDTSSSQKDWFLAIYKQKTDIEPLVSYPLSKISSCYVGDYAPLKKKSPIQPTLIVNMRNEPPPASTALGKSFRRRSQEPSRELFPKKENTPFQTLVFRSGPQGSQPLEQWAKVIQLRLATYHSSRPEFYQSKGLDAYEESYQEQSSENESPKRPPASLFIVDGEPNTTLLSPSIRSKASNLSTLQSDERDPYSSPSASPQLPPDTIHEEDDRPTTSNTITENKPIPRPAGRPPSSPLASVSTVSNPSPPPNPPPRPTARRETILDRFFSTAPESPVTATDKPMSSIARFEALMEDLETRKALQLKLQSKNAQPQAVISSPTARVLEFVATGRRPPTPPDQPPQSSSSASWRSPPPPLDPNRLPPSPIATLPKTPLSPFTMDRRNSDTASLQSIYSTSTTTTNTTEIGGPRLAPPGKRHSLADISSVRSGAGQQHRVNRVGKVLEEDEEYSEGEGRHCSTTTTDEEEDTDDETDDYCHDSASEDDTQYTGRGTTPVEVYLNRNQNRSQGAVGLGLGLGGGGGSVGGGGFGGYGWQSYRGQNYQHRGQGVAAATGTERPVFREFSF
ncbi:hypothetical protein EX30DRAFT_371268 [Ascodesmis nigricans]|uniref:Uncharacterized protein n=1 Tax=Ascodesmis nigricans TaxID=341454 RepID=A0A4S2MY86_9PEZI|nr:hypothetical protein EX30DRAFT_371268 [Ascodesmis nigricans]